MSLLITSRFRAVAGYCDWCNVYHKGRCLLEPCKCENEYHDADCPNRDRRLCIRCDRWAEIDSQRCEDCEVER